VSAVLHLFGRDPTPAAPRVLVVRSHPDNG
jgi:hypothetical protein